MSETMQQVLGTLRDVAGIQGSFLVTLDGQLLARDLPLMFSDELLGEVAPRIVRLSDGLASECGEVKSCMLRFPEHMLYLRSFGQATMCVLTAPDVNLPALKMGVNLAGRRVSAMLEAIAAPTPATPPPIPPAARSSATMPAVQPALGNAEPPPALQWRGASLTRPRG